MKKKILSYVLIVLCAVTAVWAGTAVYRYVASLLAGKAVQEQKNRIAVLSFSNEDGKKTKSSSIISERLASEVASQPKIELVERVKLNTILKEQKLQTSGLIDSNTAKAVGNVLGVDAVITGTVIDLNDGNVEMNARLVDAQSAMVIKAVTRKIKKDWEETPSAWNMDVNKGAALINLEELPVPVLPDEFFKVGIGRDCSRLASDELALRTAALKIKAKKLALGLKTGEIDIKKLRQNPGSEIPNQNLRSAFYAVVKEWYNRGNIPELSYEEKDILERGGGFLEIMDVCED